MLSRLVVSQVKHNSYFLAGLAIGLCAALVAVPLEEGGECGAASGAAGAVGAGAAGGGADEFAAEHAARPDGGGGAGPRALQRPRYYTTELGMRAPLLAAVLSSEEALGAGGAGEALNATLARLQPALRFFISASAPGAPPRANVVAFTDTREMLKPFHALKYLADNYLEEYDFFFLVSDTSYVNARRLAELAAALSVSQDVYMGARADDDSHYCTLDGGILLSNSVLRAVQGALDWCVRNSYSARHHENIGRCVLHAAHRACSTSLQNHDYIALTDGAGGCGSTGAGTDGECPVWEAVSVRGARSARRLHELHALAARQRLQRCAGARRRAAAALQHSAARAPPAQRNASWPRGLRDDPGLLPPPPDNRWDHPRWTWFNATHAFMPDDHRAVAPLSGVDAKALQLVVNASAAWAARAWGARSVALVEGARLWEPARALRYRLVLRAGGGAGGEGAAGAGRLRRVEVARTLGAARLVPVPYVTESARVWLVLPALASSSDVTAARDFLRRYEAACLRRRANTALILVLLPSTSESPADSDLSEAFLALQRQFPDASLTLDGAPPAEDSPGWGGARRRARAGRRALDAALRHTPHDALLLLADAYMDFNEDFLNRVRMNVILGSQWFLPVGFARFAAMSHPRFRGDARPATGTGRFNPAHTHVLAVHRLDYEAARAASSAGESASVAAVLGAARGLRCVSAPEPGLVLAARAPPCAVAPPPPPGDVSTAACLRSERGAHFAHVELGARHTLAKLLLETEAERA